MKTRIAIFFLFLFITGMFAISEGYMYSQKEKLDAIYDGVSKCSSQLTNPPGIQFMGFAGQQDKRFFKVLLKIDRRNISFEEFEEEMISYVKSSAAYVSVNDWREGLQPFCFRIEEMTNDSKTPVILAEKITGGTEITWKMKW